MKTHIKTLLAGFLITLSFWGCQKETDEQLLQTPPVANAGPNQTVQLPVSSITLTGSGTTQNGTITGYLWSLVSGPNVPVITTPGSASTTVTGVVTGVYIFQLMVVDNAGLTGVDTTKITFTQAPIQTLTLQPANNPNEVHVLGNSNGINNGDPNSPDFVCASWTSGDVITSRSFVKFDLSSIPVNATILTAKLTLFSNPTPLNGNLVDANFGPANAMYIQRVTSNWTPASTVWLNQPGTTTTDQVSIPHTSQSMLDLVDIDVKNLVAAMHSGNNYGFMIRLQNEVIYNIRDFCSSKYSNTAKHPKLVITYQ